MSTEPTIHFQGPTRASTISINVNNRPETVRVEPWVTLLDLLRERLHHTGTKKGCNHGACGACTVLVDGQRVLSCLTLAVTCRDRGVTTIEGLTEEFPPLHPMQDAFARHDALQCGYCTPGQIMSAVAMLREVDDRMPSAASNVSVVFEGRKHLTEREIRERMSGNLCRCAAYQNIVTAIQEVAAQSTPERESSTDPELSGSREVKCAAV
jgi:xanthine dehydrogenase YagT iron-sulfur-binding subunit